MQFADRRVCFTNEETAVIIRGISLKECEELRHG